MKRKGCNRIERKRHQVIALSGLIPLGPVVPGRCSNRNVVPPFLDFRATTVQLTLKRVDALSDAITQV